MSCNHRARYAIFFVPLGIPTLRYMNLLLATMLATAAIHLQNHRLFERRILTSRFQNHQSHGHGTRRPESPPTGGPTSESCPHGTRISTHRLPDNATNDTANTAGAAAAATFNAGTSRGQCVRRHRWKIGRDERGASGEGIGGGSGSGGSDGVMEIRLRSPAFGLSPICVSVTADSGRSAHTAQTL